MAIKEPPMEKHKIDRITIFGARIDKNEEDMVEFLSRLRSDFPDTEICLCTELGEAEARERYTYILPFFDCIETYRGPHNA